MPFWFWNDDLKDDKLVRRNIYVVLYDEGMYPSGNS
jgi:hypothetical protein